MWGCNFKNTEHYINVALLLPEVGSNELHLFRYIYLSKFFG